MSKRKIVWEIVPLNAPLIIRNCRRCKKKSKFICSGKFRVNANKGSIDVWLIYKCTACGATWNMSVVSRINIKQMDKKMYGEFLNNDERIAFDCSLNYELIRKNDVKADYSSVEFEIRGDEIEPEELLGGGYEINIKLRYKFDLRLDRLLRDMLGISRRTVYRLVETSKIVFRPCVDIRKHRIKDELQIIVLKERTSEREKE